VVVTAVIDDTGGSPQCGWLAFLRNGQETYFYVPRQIGSTSTHRFVDVDVEPGTLYCYTMDLRFAPAPVPCDPYAFCTVFDCFYDIRTCVNTGPDPAFIGHGLLSTQWPDGTPVDGNEIAALLYPCSGQSLQSLIALYQLSADAAPYLDTGEGVDVFGTWWCCWAQGVWLLVAQQVEPHSCALKVEESTWGRVKALYRD
jgi:hypothetical protein